MKSHCLRTTVMLALCVPLLTSAGALAAPHRPTQQASAIVGDSPADFAQPVAPPPRQATRPPTIPA